MLLYLALAVLAPLAVTSNYCKREVLHQANEYGWDACDENGMACCYYIHNSSVIIYSHGYNDGRYYPNTHCEYIIDVDDDCEINICYGYSFSMDGGDGLEVRTSQVNVDWRGKKKPFNVNLHGNKASISFNTDGGDVKEGSKWQIGMTCVPKNKYASICEACESIAEEMKAGPDGDEVIKVIE